MSETNETCGACRFFNDELDGVGGTCRRYPPAVAPYPYSPEVSTNCSWVGWPPIRSVSWCGEWQPIMWPGDGPPAMRQRGDKEKE